MTNAKAAAKERATIRLSAWLESIGACGEAVTRMEKTSYRATIADVKDAWERCPRGDWSVWFAFQVLRESLGAAKAARLIMPVAPLCAREALPFASDRTRPASLAAIEAAVACIADPTPQNRAAAADA